MQWIRNGWLCDVGCLMGYQPVGTDTDDLNPSGAGCAQVGDADNIQEKDCGLPAPEFLSIPGALDRTDGMLSGETGTRTGYQAWTKSKNYKSNPSGGHKRFFRYTCQWPMIVPVDESRPARCEPSQCYFLDNVLDYFFTKADPLSLRTIGYNLTYATGARQEGLPDPEPFAEYSCFDVYDYSGAASTTTPLGYGELIMRSQEGCKVVCNYGFDPMPKDISG